MKKSELRQMIREELMRESDDEIIQLNINGQNWFLKKIDSTHLYFANDKNAILKKYAMAWHVGQLAGEPYYDDVRNWLHGKGIPKGKKYISR